MCDPYSPFGICGDHVAPFPISSARSLPLAYISARRPLSHCCHLRQQLLALPSRRSSRTARQKAVATQPAVVQVHVQVQVSGKSLSSQQEVACARLLKICPDFVIFGAILCCCCVEICFLPRFRVLRSVGTPTSWVVAPGIVIGCCL